MITDRFQIVDIALILTQFVGMPATAVRYKTQVDGYARIEEADTARICRTSALKEACTRAGGFLTVATLGVLAARFLPRECKDQRPE